MTTLPPPNPMQVQGWARSIRKEVAAGHALDVAVNEARASFEAQQAGPLDHQQQSNWLAARDLVRDELNRPLENLQRVSLRKPRRPHWYSPPLDGGMHWSSLAAYLQERRGWADAVASIDATSTEVVSLLENPNQTVFRGRGLVVGYVQSGKTANMTATIAKAVDAGYRFIIVLAGLTNALRKQTQRRLNADLFERHRHSWLLHTTEDDTGDFRIPANRWFVVAEQAQVAVVKKNVTPLRRLLATIKQTIPSHRDRLPFLIIDDECDQASVNAGGQFNITRINGQIRELLTLLPRAQYVGYTATPFANVLINPESQPNVMDDLYPEDFITPLPKPEGYFGPEVLFGRDAIDADEETPDANGLDMIRHVFQREAAALRPASVATRFNFAPTMTPSLRRALLYFLLATACRYHRGQHDQHCSMLVHTTTYTIPHDRLAGVIRAWLTTFATEFAAGRHDERLKRLWASEASRVPASTFGLAPASYEDLRPHITTLLRDLEVVVENSDSESRLDFTAGPKKYIVVGGSVLARGLTIEGLTVSLFVRSSSQYDTLLQMGRWFGYRPGYQDLPRIWMTAELADSFRDLATVEAEIRSDMAVYRDEDRTPADYAVRIRQIPGMTITAASKMIHAEACDVSFSGEHLQTIRFPAHDSAVLRANWGAAGALAAAAAAVAQIEPGNGGRVIRGVPLAAVMQFLRTYQSSQKDRFELLTTYITEESTKPDAPFAAWNIGIVEPAAGILSVQPLGAFGPVRLVTRSRLAIQRADGFADIKALMSRADVLIDVNSNVRGADWRTIKRARQDIVGARTPLLLLYAINRNSAPAAGSVMRAPLDAVQDVLGVGVVMPDRGLLRSYVRVRLPAEDAEETEDLSADLPPDAGDDA